MRLFSVNVKTSPFLTLMPDSQLNCSTISNLNANYMSYLKFKSELRDWKARL